VVESLDRLAQLVTVKSASVSSTLALLERAIEPNHGIKATLNQQLGWLFLGSWLHEQESFFHFHISLDLFKLWVRHVTTESLFKELGLSIVAREVD